MSYRLIQGDCLEVLPTLEVGSVHCCVTSPPYYGLRDYGTGAWEGGNPECNHEVRTNHNGNGTSTLQGSKDTVHHAQDGFKTHCLRCGARRVDRQLGLEPTSEEYVARLVEVFRQVRRVLRDDGTLWLNLGSAYNFGIIESEDYVIRDDLTDQEYAHVACGVAETLSPLRSSNAQGESQVSRLLAEGTRATEELPEQNLSQVRQSVSGSQVANRTRAGKVLFPELRSVRESGQEEDVASGGMSDVRRNVQQVPCRDSQEPGATALLQPGVLVQLQPERQSLSLDGRTERQDEPRCNEVAEVGAEKGPQTVPSLSSNEATGGTSHLPVREVPGETLGGGERDNALPQMPHKATVSRNGAHRNSTGNRQYAGHRIKLTLRKQDIPWRLLPFFRPVYSIGPKNDLGMPWRVAFALQADGWILRSDIIWAKPNPMPESVRDRPTKAHEYLFLLSKRPTYYYDAEAIREPYVIGNGGKQRAALRGTFDYAGRDYKTRSAVPLRNDAGKQQTGLEKCGYNHGGRNRRSVWTIATRPYKGAHFAVFPPALVEPCVLAGTSEHGCCPECAAPWRRMIERHPDTRPPVNCAGVGPKAQSVRGDGNKSPRVRQENGKNVLAQLRHVHVGWQPTCQCGHADTVPCTVIDPFAGAGTTGLVAIQHDRRFVGVELNPAYLEMARQRLETALPLTAEAA